MTSATRAPIAVLRLMVAVGLGAGVAACAALKYEPVSTDSPRPATTAADCHQSLAEGERCLAVVYANQLHSSTRLQVEAGQRYRVTVAPNQFWFDAGRRNEPPRGEPGNSMMKLFARYKRDPSDWFTLMAVVMANPPLAADPVVGHDLHRNPVFAADRQGVLALYPNDVPAYYGNNSGHVWVCIERIAAGGPQAALPLASDARFCGARW